MIQRCVSRWLAAGVAVATLGGCAEMTQTEKGAAIGALAGSAAGAIIGNQVRGNRPQHAALGAIIGGLGGAATGALIGHEAERRQAAAAPVVPQAPPPAPAAAPLPPPPPVTVAGGYQGDPTRGTIVNGTRWRVSLYVDVEPASASSPTATLVPQEVRPINLDIGPHRVVAQAFVDTQFGTRAVGRLDRVIAVDARTTGWDLRLAEPDFR